MPIRPPNNIFLSKNWGRSPVTNHQSRSVRHILQNIDNHIGILIENNDVRANHAAAVFRGKRWQLALEFHGAWLNALLQSRRQRTFPLELLLKPRRQVPAALGKPRRKIRAALCVVARRHFTVMDPQTKFATLVFILPLVVFVLPFSFTLTFTLPNPSRPNTSPPHH